MSAGFDAVASRYDELWTYTDAGRAQRRAVWRHLDPLFHPGDTILDVGCGTGEDALHFMRAGVEVRGIDQSAEMVRMARGRGVDARLLCAEKLNDLDGCFNGIFSNFGALNCLEDMAVLRAPFARLVRPGGHLAVCILGRVCAWETAWYLLRGSPAKAFRRWSGASYSESLGARIVYPKASTLKQAFATDFELVGWRGIGLAVPPSYAGRRPRWAIHFFDVFDRYTAHLAGLRAVCDHRLFVFIRR